RNPQGGVSRVAYSEADKQGRAYVTQLMRDAGLDVRVDAAANIFGRRAGSDASLEPIVIGSHTDSVPEGGNYDGDVGSLGAIEVAQTLHEAKVGLRHPLDVRAWTVEGFANHAGTTPMDQRHDALLAAARFVQAVNRVVRGVPGRQVGTVGRIQAFPGAPNVIPGKVVLSLELRDLDAAKIRALYAKIKTEADAIAKDS